MTEADPLTVACVWTGTKYPFHYVLRLQRAVFRHLRRPHEFLCVTDRPPSGVLQVPGLAYYHVGEYRLPGWWAKMHLFDPAVRGARRTVYLDLDTIIVGDLGPLVDLDVPFGICRNFTRYRQERDTGRPPTWPCHYGSCVMVFAPGWGLHVWSEFYRRATHIMRENRRGGDQRAIHALEPDAAILQDLLPEGYFLHYRDFRDQADPRAAIAIFGGRHTPENHGPSWIREGWA